MKEERRKGKGENKKREKGKKRREGKEKRKGWRRGFKNLKRRRKNRKTKINRCVWERFIYIHE